MQSQYLFDMIIIVKNDSIVSIRLDRIGTQALQVRILSYRFLGRGSLRYVLATV